MKTVNRKVIKVMKVIIKILILCCSIIFTKSQRSVFDNLVPMRNSILRYYMKIQDHNYAEGKRAGLFQHEYPQTSKFFCDTKHKRSSIRPTSIHELQPGDIDVIAAMGDSLTAGHGIGAVHLLQVPIEYRSLSWSIGGKKTWRQYLTLPNILKQFNPNLYGYSIEDSITAERASKFNVAEGGAMSRDMPYQAKVLHQRLKYDRKVNMENDWKMLTLLIGGNDLCSDMCYFNDRKKVIRNHENDMLKTLRYLRNNIPKLMVNIVTAVNVSKMIEMNHKPYQCLNSGFVVCPCFHGVKRKGEMQSSMQLIKEWIDKDDEIAAMDEFNTNDFTVNIQPFFKTIHMPVYKNGYTNYHYLSADCFHFSQKLNSKLAVSLWNNLIQPIGNKTSFFSVNNKEFVCPTIERPFIATRENSKN